MKLPFSPAARVRVIPFAVFMLLLQLRGMAPADGAWGFDPRWIYGLTVLVVGALLALWWRDYGELSAQLWPSWREAGLAVGVGLLVFALWIQLDAPWMQLAPPTAMFIPLDAQGNLIWPLVAVRWLGAALLVPVIAHAVTNGALGVWVVATGNWAFW